MIPVGIGPKLAIANVKSVSLPSITLTYSFTFAAIFSGLNLHVSTLI
jgi:hypothetical protein